MALADTKPSARAIRRQRRYDKHGIRLALRRARASAMGNGFHVRLFAKKPFQRRTLHLHTAPILYPFPYTPLLATTLRAACHSLILNTISGDEFWVSEPSRYPHKYYGFSTELRLHVFVGQRLRFEIPRNRRSYVKAVSFCYELSSCDLYLASYVPNRYLSLRDILSLSFSIKVDAF